jgi:mannosyltransferase OCH1-like enzyme
MARIVRYLAARLTKFIGNFMKVLYYPLHFLFPTLRFSLPHRSEPIFAANSAHRIPKVIWQTNYTDRITLPVYLNYLFNRCMSPTYAYRFMGPRERAQFILECCSADVFECYSKLKIGAAQADLWRVLVLRQFGGVYLDIDAHVVWPLGFIVKPDYEELYLQHKYGSVSNYFLASTRDNPHLDLILTSILDNVRTHASNDVSELTGPMALDRALKGLNVPTTYYKHTCYQGSFTNEFFQYIDHPQGKWTRVQQIASVVARQNGPPENSATAQLHSAQHRCPNPASSSSSSFHPQEYIRRRGRGQPARLRRGSFR